MNTDLTIQNTVTPALLPTLLEDLYQENQLLEERGARKVVPNIQGKPGIGKTQIVKEFACAHDLGFVMVTPDMLAEVGDLNGLPDIERLACGEAVTRLRPPEWVFSIIEQSGKKPGCVLLFDDHNRVDPQVMNAEMSIFQNHRIAGLDLPKGLFIVLTSNPGGGEFMVSEMDDAQKDRIQTFCLEFDPDSWYRWAEQSGINPFILNFALRYPEALCGRKTTPRSIEAFSHFLNFHPEYGKTLAQIREGVFDDHLHMISLRAKALLDEETVGSFLGFLMEDHKLVVTPESILNHWLQIKDQLIALSNESPKRTDILGIITHRLALHLTSEKYCPEPEHRSNLEHFLTDGIIPEDLTLSVVQQLINAREDTQKLILSDRIYDQLKVMWDGKENQGEVSL